MEIEEAYEMAMKNSKIKDLVGEGFYLSSALLKQAHLHSADSWILIFFNPNTGKVFSATVSNDGISISDVQDPLKKGDYREMNLKGRGDIQGILDLVSSEFNAPINQVLISAKPDSWEALVIGNNMSTMYLIIDPKTRRVIKKERGSMLG